ncbi:MarR family transcriptional regulator [Sphingomonas sp. BT-65]|uniref:MarR family transcriptional regulator n=1 Tax=Sphingomonas sp. BT-65 TaxID=2989821 RepID=UPI0022369825|nr:MarR family transcriptional regulator [Sphingomonas sp. BT-65]MCW4460923.1 MarR family transcriptional regulator [Sphingomonas sp. BT-65]
MTYPQYLVLNVLWREDSQTVGSVANQLALESSTLTPLLKRLETAGLIQRARNPENERQVIVSITDKGAALRSKAACLGDTLLTASGETPAALGKLNRQVAELRDAVYDHIGGWASPEAHSPGRP